MSRIYENLIGKRFCRLVVTDQVKSKRRQRMWKCKCDCGSITTTSSTLLNTGHSRSCGCLRLDNLRKKLVTHGMSGTPEHKAWMAMKNRCYNKTSPYFYCYGGRGIKVCDRWIDSFQNFLSDMGRRPKGMTSIDRINNDGDYEPGNCRWANNEMQINNRSVTRNLTYNGITKTISQWSRTSGINFGTLYSRIENGWSVEESLTLKPALNNKIVRKQMLTKEE